MSKSIPEDRLYELKNRLDLMPPRSSERKNAVAEFGKFYNFSSKTIYRRLRKIKKPKLLHRSDSGIPRKMSKFELEKYCEIIAAMKIRTSNNKGRHLSTNEAIRLLEEVGIETPGGFVKAPKSLLKKSTVNRYLKKWGYRLDDLSVQPVSTRFQATYSNECWQFDLSPSDLKTIDELPPWIDAKKKRPVLMLYSVVDDRSGVAYQEYSVVYGEDVEAGLAFLFRAMSSKEIEGFPFQGRPEMIYMDNGPIYKSHVFHRVMNHLDIQVHSHMPKNKDGRRVTARAKGKVERPFKTVKEVHETLYHFHKPKNTEEANKWLLNYLIRYNIQNHRSENHSRIEDWKKKLPSTGVRRMCSWERFCKFARVPEKRKVGPDANVSIDGIVYQVSHELADQEVSLWWGLFDNELFVEWNDEKFGPYFPNNMPIPLHSYRSYKKTESEIRADKIEKLAKELNLPISALTTKTVIPKELIKTLDRGINYRKG